MKDSKQYPPQIGKYAIKVKNGGGWSAFSAARLQISVGQEYHEGEKIKATIEWARHRFGKVIICVNDTLQRHNYLYESSLGEDDAFSQAQNAGREWIERNIAIIRRLPNYKIYRWEDWRKSPQFKAEHDYIQDLYYKDNLVWDLVNQEILTFWKRRMAKENNAPSYTFADFKKASIDYLLEEIAAFFLMFKHDEAVDIYPGSVLLPCVLAQKYCESVKSNSMGQRAFTRIDFQRNDKSDRNLTA